jgi:predicted nucleic acid-binding Zn ribbon protein
VSEPTGPAGPAGRGGAGGAADLPAEQARGDEGVAPELADEDVDHGGEPGVGDADDAAAAALLRARAAAREKGLRPGLKPIGGRRRPGGAPSPTQRRDGRDPLLLGDQMDRLLSDRGWKVDVAVGSVMGRWNDIVGPEVAQHCTPVTFEMGVLTVRADSTAWTTQLQLLESSIMARLEGEVGKDTVVALKIVGPSAPSWSRGPRRSQGPGPRDTYG